MSKKKISPRLKIVFLSAALLIGSTSLVTAALPEFLTSSLRATLTNFLTSDATSGASTVSSSPALAPMLITDKTGYLAGDPVSITASGYLPGEALSISLSRTGSEVIQTWNVFADSNGAATVSWSIDPADIGGNNFSAVVIGGSGTASTDFKRIVQIRPNRFTFEPGDEVAISGEGFRPGENVLIEIARANLDNSGTPKQPFEVTADELGRVGVEWTADPGDMNGAIFRITAQGQSSFMTDAAMLATGSTFLENPVEFSLISEPVLDDGGPDDQPGQKDLNQLQEDDGDTEFGIAWNWDDVAWTGNNTGDACALIDTDQDGNANYAFCVFVQGKPAQFAGDMFYSCGDTRADRCAQPVVEITDHDSIAAASIVPDSDPFRTFPSHQTGNVCNDTPSGSFTYDCRNDDTVANVTIQKGDLGGATDPRVVNVCSYPSGQPNSDPSDCVFNPQNGFLVITKVANPDDETAFVFNASRNSQTGVSQWTINGSGSTPAISYTSTSTVNLSEVVPGGWALDSASCSINSTGNPSTGTFSGTTISNISIQPGLTTTCTFTNSLQTGTLIVNKVVVNDNGGTATADDFSFQVDGGTAIPFEADGSNSLTVEAGTYNVTEPAFSGYSTSYDNCSNVVVPAGGTATCTITNDDAPPSLTLVKVVTNDNGGTSVTTDFTLSANGPTPISGAGGATSDATFDAGTYALSETGPSGYSASAWSCAGGTQDGSNITVGLDESATCTITNDDQAGNLIIIKNVINDNGGSAVVGDFSGTIGGTATFSGGNTWTGTTAPGQTKVTTGVGTYNVAENAYSGYSVSYSADCTGSIALGETKTCTVTNDDIAPSLTLVKVVVNDNGGNAVVSDFPLFINGNAVTSGVSNTLSANTLYTATETNLSGYTPSAWSGDCAADGTITLQPGDNKTCSITNDDVAPTLTLIKTVVNDNGGNAGSDDFALTIGGNAAISGTAYTMDANTAYAVNETQLAGYSFVGITGNAKCPAVLGGTVTLDEGENVTCTITNDDIAPILRLRKVVINDNGGSATSANFTLTANGTGANDISGTSPVDSGAGLQADTFALSETGPSGYEASAWVCVGGSQSGSNITVAIGQEATCTITNNDIPPSLTLIKYVVNNNGGNAAATAWTLSASGPTPISGAGGATSGASFSAGTYSLAESGGPSGYTASDWSCVGGTQNGSQITLGVGQASVCNITNDDQQAYITVTKVVNGGTALPNDFNLTLEGSAVTSGVAVPVNPGTYTAGETLLPSYSFVGFSGDCDSSGDVTVALGQSKTCTLTNRYNPPLTVTKNAATTFTRTFAWTIDKSATPETLNMFRGDSSSVDYGITVTKDSGTDSAWAVSGTITVSNTSLADANLTGVTDSISGVGAASVDCGVTFPYVLAAGSTLNCSYSSPLPDGTNLTNTATATATGEVLGGSGSAAVNFGDPTTIVNGSINVDDTNGSSWGFSSSGTVNYSENFACDADEGSHNNTATIRETGQSDSASVTVNCYDLAVTKTAQTALTRTYSWTIDKSADQSSLTLSVGQIFGVNYQVAVNTSSVDSGWGVSGTISVNNPAPMAATINSVSDVISPSTAALVDCGVSFPYSLAAGATLNCSYSAALPDASARTNTATATLQNSPSGTTDFSGSAPVSFEGASVSLIDEAVDVTDSLQGYLGTVTAASAPATFNYQRSVGPYSTCSNYQVSNMASFTTNDTGSTGSDNWTVNITVPCGTILVRKVVLSPNASDTPDDFSYTFDGGSPITFNADGSSPTSHVVNPSVYTIAEPVTDGFVASYSGDCNSQGQITAVGGETKTCTITNAYLTGFVTSSSLCTFDVDGDSTNGNQFRLLLTPDVQQGYGIFKLNASNPGQYYYNVLHYNPTAGNETVTLTIPFPFVTQGATPLHVYNSVTTQVNGSSVCLLPGTELFNQQSIITLADYGDYGTFGDNQTVQVSVPPGFTYINIHLDYGLKRTTNYLRGAGDTADNTNDLWDIINGQGYTFSNGGSQTVFSVNEFKKNPGVAGLTVTTAEEPIPGSEIELWLGTKRLGTTATDNDGWYQIYYKHLGKAQTFYVKWVNNGTVVASKPVQLKANGFAEVSFP